MKKVAPRKRAQRQSAAPALFPRTQAITYRGTKRFVRLDLKTEGGELPHAGAVAILTDPKDATHPPIKVVAAIYPDDEPGARFRFDAKCTKAGELAIQAMRGGATFEEARQIIAGFMQTEIDAAELQSIAPYARGRASVLKGLKRENQQRQTGRLEREQKFLAAVNKLCQQHPSPALKTWTVIRKTAAEVAGVKPVSTYRYGPKQDPRK